MRFAFPLRCAGAALIALCVACSGSKSFSKKAAQLDASGMYAEAADMYLQSAVRNQKNVEAKIGLKKTGQQLLNDKLSAFFKAFSMGEKERAVNAYLDAKDYADRVGRAGVVLEIPDHNRADFNEIKGQYLVELYTQGQDLLSHKDYKGAEALFARIGQLEPGYKDAGSLQNVAYLEPLYLSGRSALQAGQYRKAYAEFGKIVEKDVAYKDAQGLRNECITKGRYAVAVLPFSGPEDRKAEIATVQAYATTALTGSNDPFLSVVDRENMQRILEEQRLGMTGVIDERTAVSAGKLLGAQAVLMGTLINFREEQGKLRQSTKDGFESYQVKQVNRETNETYLVTKYKPVKYTEYYRENKVVLSLSYKLVSLETGEVLLSKVVDQETEDHAWYASYEGNKAQLFPMQNGVVDTNNNARRDLTSLLNGQRSVKSTDVLGNDLLRSACAGMATTIQQELASKIP
jgi:curli biogenesis system outer membrane secretion channel CsgG